MNMLGLLGAALLAAGAVMLIKQMFPPAASLLTIAFGVMTLTALLAPMREYAAMISAFFSAASLGGEYAAVMLKAMGVVLLTQLSSEACQELGAPGIARYAELCGRVMLLGIAAPVFVSLTQMAVNVLQ